MRKISGIIPPNARTQSAEISRSQPARPGAPSMGRPMGKNSLGDRVTLSQELEEMRANGDFPVREMTTYTPKMQEARRAKAVQELSDKFFNPRGGFEDEEAPRSESVAQVVSKPQRLYAVEPELMAKRPELEKA